MSPTITREGVSSPMATFFDALLGSNPFSSNRVSDVDEPLLDVSTIHQDKFEKLCRITNEVRRADKPPAKGVLLSAGAGVGKSHLLARLCQWAKKEKSAIYVYLHNVMASPERMSRHFLRSVMSALLKGRESYKESLLYHLMQAAMKTICDESQLPRHELSQSKARRAFCFAQRRHA